MTWCSVIARWKIHLLVLIVCSVLCAPVARAATQADILLHRQAPGRTFGNESDTLLTDDFGGQAAQLVADSFTLTDSSPICRTRFWGFYGSEFAQVPEAAPASETMRVRIYADSNGLPGAVVYERTILNPSRTATGFSIAIGPGPLEYLYDVEFPSCFMQAAETPYWFEASQLGDLSSRFRIESSSLRGGFAVQFPIDTAWRLTPTTRGQLAYEWWTPEPCSGVLLALAVGIVRRFAAVRR